MNYRTDVFADADLAKEWKASGGKGEWGLPKTWEQVNAVTKFLKGRSSRARTCSAISIRPRAGAGSGFYFLEDRATAYVKHPDDKAWLFDVDTMKPARQQSGVGCARSPKRSTSLQYEPADQINADPNTTAFQQFLAGTGSMVTWWGDVGQTANTSDTSVIGDVVGFDLLPGSEDVYNHKAGKWEKAANGINVAPNCAYLGLGVYVMARVDKDEKKKKAAWSARGPSRRQRSVALDRDVSVGLPSPSQQPFRYRGMGGRRLQTRPISKTI